MTISVIFSVSVFFRSDIINLARGNRAVLLASIRFLFSSMMIYGAVIFNYGTAARYRFPFLLLFVLFADRMTIAPAKKPKLDKTAKKTS